MTDQSIALPATPMKTRPFYWSVRRELWENRAVYLAPAVAAAVVLLGLLLSTFTLSHAVFTSTTLGDEAPHDPMRVDLYSTAAMVIIVTMFLVAVFYCLGSLHSERRDRSILFWKSLPVSDLTTVLAKATVPFVILPVVTFVMIVVMQVLIGLLTSSVGAIRGLDSIVTWSPLGFAERWLVLAYGLVALSLWLAPVYGWLMLVSGWAPRATFLWAVLPPLALCVLEGLAFRTSYLAQILHHRLKDCFIEAYSGPQAAFGIVDPRAQPDPVQYLSNPDLWIGLAIGAGLLAAAIWMRRYREPI